MVEEVLGIILSEYGILVSFLSLSAAILLYAVRILWEQNKHLANKLLETVENNTKVLTQIVDKLDSDV